MLEINGADEAAMQRIREEEEKWNKYKITEPSVNACCPTDCTGLMPRPPLSDEERQSYKDIYQYEPIAVPLYGKSDEEHFPQ